MLTVPDAAKHTGAPETTIRSAMEKGGIPFQTIYGRKVVKLADVEEYLRTSRRGRPKRQEDAAYSIRSMEDVLEQTREDLDAKPKRRKKQEGA